MAAKGNAFALLEGDDDGDGESLLALLSTAAAVKPELPPSAVDIRTDKTKKPRASSLSSFQSSSAPQRSSDHGMCRAPLFFRNVRWIDLWIRYLMDEGNVRDFVVYMYFL